MAIEFFTRKELKFLITQEQYKRLLIKIMPYMRADKNGQDGYYNVSSLYFDNDENDIYFETKNKLKFRQKLRLRTYDDVSEYDQAFFEIKQKDRGVVHKRRMVIPLNEAYRYLNEEEKLDLSKFNSSNPFVFKEIDAFKNMYQLKPKMIVSYDRHALHSKTDDDLRMTFDMNLLSRKHNLQLENGAYGEHFVDPNLVILEVKVMHSVPLWLSRILQEVNCYFKSSSKYCTSYEKLFNEEINNLYCENTLVGGF